MPGKQITLLGAGGKEGHLLAVLLKRLPLVERLKLHGNQVLKTAIDNENTDCIVKCFKGNDSITDAVKGADIIVLNDDNTKKPLDKASFKQRAAQIIEYASKIASANNTKGVVVVAMSPVNLAVPVVSRVLGGEDRVLGVTGADSAHASAILASHLQVSPGRIFLPVVGGSSPETRVPLFSKTKPYVSLPERAWQKLMGRMKCEAEREKHLKATVRLVQALLRGGVEPAFTRTDLVSGVDYFSLPVVLGECGLQRRIPLSGSLLPLEQALLTEALASLTADVATAHALLDQHLPPPAPQSSDSGLQQEPLSTVKDSFQDGQSNITRKESCTDLNSIMSNELGPARPKILNQDNLSGISEDVENTNVRGKEDKRPISLLGFQKNQENTSKLLNPTKVSEVSKTDSISLNTSLKKEEVFKTSHKCQFTAINPIVSNKCIKSGDSSNVLEDKIGDSQSKNMHYESEDASISIQESSNPINNAIQYCPFDLTFIRNKMKNDSSLNDKSSEENPNLLKTKQVKPENRSDDKISKQIDPINKTKKEISMEVVEDYLKNFFSDKRKNTLNKKDAIINNNNQILKNVLYDNKSQCKKECISGKLVTVNDDDVTCVNEKPYVKINDQSTEMVHSDNKVEKYLSNASCHIESKALVCIDKKNAITNSTKKDNYYNNEILETLGKEVKIINKDKGPTSLQEMYNSSIKLPLNSDSISEIPRQDVVSRNFYNKQKESVNSNLPCKEALRFSSSEAFDKIDTPNYIAKKRNHKLCTEDVKNFFREKMEKTYPKACNKPLQSQEGPTAHILKRSYNAKFKLEKLKNSNAYDDSLTKKIQERQRKLIIPVNSSSFTVKEISNDNTYFFKNNTFQTKKSDSIQLTPEKTNKSTEKSIKADEDQKSKTQYNINSNKSALCPQGNKMEPKNNDGKMQEMTSIEGLSNISGDNSKKAISPDSSSGSEVQKEIRAPGGPACGKGLAHFHHTPLESNSFEDQPLLLSPPSGPK